MKDLLFISKIVEIQLVVHRDYATGSASRALCVRYLPAVLGTLRPKGELEIGSSEEPHRWRRRGTRAR